MQATLRSVIDHLQQAHLEMVALAADLPDDEVERLEERFAALEAECLALAACAKNLPASHKPNPIAMLHM